MTYAVKLPPASPEAEQHRQTLADAIGQRRYPKGQARIERAKERAAFIEDVEWLIGQGVCIADITSRYRISLQTISRRLEREGRPDLAAHFWRYYR